MKKQINHNKYKKGRGWHGQSYRHYLAAKGIKTQNRFLFNPRKQYMEERMKDRLTPAQEQLRDELMHDEKRARAVRVLESRGRIAQINQLKGLLENARAEQNDVEVARLEFEIQNLSDEERELGNKDFFSLKKERILAIGTHYDFLTHQEKMAVKENDFIAAPPVPKQIFKFGNADTSGLKNFINVLENKSFRNQYDDESLEQAKNELNLIETGHAVSPRVPNRFTLRGGSGIKYMKYPEVGTPEILSAVVLKENPFEIILKDGTKINHDHVLERKYYAMKGCKYENQL